MKCFFGHSWHYGEVRKVDMFKVRTLLGEPFGNAIEFMEEHQYRTCVRCGLVQDKQVKINE